MNPPITFTLSTTALPLDALQAAAAAEGSEHDFWEFISGTVIQRFLDFFWVKHHVSQETLRAYRADLVALDRWMLLFKQKTLVTAVESDVREYLDATYAAGDRAPRELPSLSCIKRFYAFLMEGGFREDDPTEHVFVRTPRLVRRDLSVVRTARAM
ncbi:MAG: site-specific integrase [Gammaproteobacteria bacterium]